MNGMKTTHMGSGILQTMKDKVNYFLSKMNLSRERSIELVLCAGAGIVSGFVLKRYFPYLIALGILILVLAIAHYYGFVTVMINMTKIERTFGLKPIAGYQGTLVDYITGWVKTNTTSAITFTVGLLIGLKLA